MPSCESGYTYPEPNNHRFVWGTCYAAHVATYDEISGTRRSVSPWQHTLDSDPVGLKYRCQWSPPLAIDWFDNSVYFGCQVVFRTRDRGQSWEQISGDLSTGNPELIRFSGGGRSLPRSSSTIPGSRRPPAARFTTTFGACCSRSAREQG